MAESGLFLKVDNLKWIMDNIKTLTSHDVWVGFPEGGESRTDTTMTNAEIAFIQENGSPALNIPARPFMVPGVRAVQSRVVRLLELAAVAGLNGEQNKSLIYLEQIGMIGVAGVQRAITQGVGWPPLAPSTLAARRRRGVRRTHPLIDTGQLRQHVTYVIRKKSLHWASPDISYMLQIKRL